MDAWPIPPPPFSTVQAATLAFFNIFNGPKPEKHPLHYEMRITAAV
jgi:hypothetical protein